MWSAAPSSFVLECIFVCVVGVLGRMWGWGWECCCSWFDVQNEDIWICGSGLSTVGYSFSYDTRSHMQVLWGEKCSRFRCVEGYIMQPPTHTHTHTQYHLLWPLSARWPCEWVVGRHLNINCLQHLISVFSHTRPRRLCVCVSMQMAMGATVHAHTHISLLSFSLQRSLWRHCCFVGYANSMPTPFRPTTKTNLSGRRGETLYKTTPTQKHTHTHTLWPDSHTHAQLPFIINFTVKCISRKLNLRKFEILKGHCLGHNPHTHTQPRGLRPC